MKFVKAKLFGQQKGITLVETSIGLAIAAVIVGTAYAGFESNSRRNEVQTNASLITEMISDAKKMFGQPGRYLALTTASAIGSRVIPDSVVSGTTASNSYGGAITIVGNSLSDATLSFEAVPKRQCMDLAMALAGSVQDMTVAGTSVFAETSATDETLVLNVGTLKTQCEAGATADLAVTFGRG